MTITTLERAVPRERSWTMAGSSALTSPVWVEPARPEFQPAPAESRLGVVIPLRRSSEVIADRGLRLTRRGRLALTLATAGCVLAIAGLAVAPPSSAPEASTPTTATSVVVAPGDTLWDLALRADPQADPRVTVARIVELNNLAGGYIQPGQKLQLPTD